MWLYSMSQIMQCEAGKPVFINIYYCSILITPTGGIVGGYLGIVMRYSIHTAAPPNLELTITYDLGISQ